MPILNGSTKISKRGWHCPGAEQLAAYIDGKLSDVERPSLERHLADCRYCLSLVAGVISDTSRATPAIPVWLRRKAQELAGAKGTKTWRWAWALAPAVACLLLVVVVLVEQPTKRGKVPPAGASISSELAQTSNASGERTRSRTRQPEPLRVLAPPNGTTVGRTELRFEWSAVPNALSYQIRITATDGGLLWEGRSEQPQADPPRTVRLAAKDYFVWVTAYLDDGRELRSAPVQFRVKP